HTRCYRDWSSDVCSSDLSTLFNTTVSVRVGASKAVTFIGDAGPTLGNPYWNTGAPPAIGGCLSDQLATNLGVSNGCTSGGTPFGQATVLLRSGNAVGVGFFLSLLFDRF